jgi:hypothetical protein
MEQPREKTSFEGWWDNYELNVKATDEPLLNKEVSVVKVKQSVK